VTGLGNTANCCHWRRQRAATRNISLHKMDILKKRINMDNSLLQVMPKEIELSRKYNKHDGTLGV